MLNWKTLDFIQQYGKFIKHIMLQFYTRKFDFNVFVAPKKGQKTPLTFKKSVEDKRAPQLPEADLRGASDANLTKLWYALKTTVSRYNKAWYIYKQLVLRHNKSVQADGEHLE